MTKTAPVHQIARTGRIVGGCKRGNEYRAKKIQESRQKQAENEFNGYLFGKYITRQHKSMKFKKGRLK